MADKEQDKPNHNRSALKEDLKAASNDAVGSTLLAATFIIPTALLFSGLETSVSDNFKYDYDLSTGILNTEKNFSHIVDPQSVSNQNTDLLLVRHGDGQFALYKQHNGSNQRLILMDYDEALSIIDGMDERLENYIQRHYPDQDLSPLAQYYTIFANTRFDESVSVPFSFDGEIERIREYTHNDQVRGNEIRQRYSEEAELWRQAAEAITANPEAYGVNESALLEDTSSSFTSAFLHNAAGISPQVFALLSSFGLLGGAASFVINRNGRRKRLKQAENQTSKTKTPAEKPVEPVQTSNDNSEKKDIKHVPFAPQRKAMRSHHTGHSTLPKPRRR